MNLVEDPRAAGEVRRYHTWAVIKDQNVASHTWQILRILLTIWPNVPRNVLVYVLVHDMGEMSGDIQFPFKLMFTELKIGSDKAETHVRNEQGKRLGAPRETHPLSPFERQVFKACDNLEMWEYSIRERNMGNLYANIMISRMNEAVAINVANLEGMRGQQQYEQNAGVVQAIHRYMKTRLEMESEVGKQ